MQKIKRVGQRVNRLQFTFIFGEIDKRKRYVKE